MPKNLLIIDYLTHT